MKYRVTTDLATLQVMQATDDGDIPYPLPDIPMGQGRREESFSEHWMPIIDKGDGTYAYLTEDATVEAAVAELAAAPVKGGMTRAEPAVIEAVVTLDETWAEAAVVVDAVADIKPVELGDGMEAVKP